MSALRTILYVEDDARVRALVKMVLEVAGHYDVIDCGSARAALALAAYCEPDLLLLDAAMPGLDGLATLGQLRRFPQMAHTPVIFLTGHTASWNVAQYMAAGALGMIAKPVAPPRLVAQLRALWQRPRGPRALERNKAPAQTVSTPARS
ncbi:response regulator [Janthinobacterium sp.]|uniref:response regulator n=1 Tax=Janthinobacterium sp. TaxID=1871054 RepID=UPI00293D7B48|nr:response regulator [Janthinobacterium sp.]